MPEDDKKIRQEDCGKMSQKKPLIKYHRIVGTTGGMLQTIKQIMKQLYQFKKVPKNIFSYGVSQCDKYFAYAIPINVSETPE